MKPGAAFSAQGAGGSYLFLVPDLDLVAVFTGEPDQGLPATNFFRSFLQMSWMVWLPEMTAVGMPPPGLTHCPAM